MVTSIWLPGSAASWKVQLGPFAVVRGVPSPRASLARPVASIVVQASDVMFAVFSGLGTRGAESAADRDVSLPPESAVGAGLAVPPVLLEQPATASTAKATAGTASSRRFTWPGSPSSRGRPACPTPWW